MLVARALAHDHHAFAQLFRRHANDVHAFAQRRLRSPDEADDIVAAAFEKAWRSLDRLGAEHGERFRPWVFRIAANEMVDHHRSTARRQRREHLAAVRGDVAVAGRATDEQPVVFDDGELVLEALGRLSEQHQEVISLRHLAGLDPAETAAALGISKSNVGVRLHRAVAALRAEIDSLEEGRP